MVKEQVSSTGGTKHGGWSGFALSQSCDFVSVM